MKTCPRCKGEKCLGVLAKGAIQVLSCDICEGAGEISDEQMQLWTTGQEMREERLIAGLTLREAAAKIGCSPSVLSCRERGKPLPKGVGDEATSV